jgi:hypothetical protein
VLNGAVLLVAGGVTMTLEVETELRLYLVEVAAGLVEVLGWGHFTAQVVLVLVVEEMVEHLPTDQQQQEQTLAESGAVVAVVVLAETVEHQVKVATVHQDL